jgi:hypothetical protein
MEGLWDCVDTYAVLSCSVVFLAGVAFLCFVLVYISICFCCHRALCRKQTLQKPAMMFSTALAGFFDYERI